MKIVFVSLSIESTFGTFTPADVAFVRSFASDFVRRVLIFLSRVGWRYPLAVLSFRIVA